MYKFLGTFCQQDNVPHIIEVIKKTFSDVNKIFVLDIGCDEVLCTYNTSFFENRSDLIHTIILNRKKQFNTIYTINAINTITQREGIRDLNWNLYKNQILLIRNNEPYITTTKIIDIIH